MSSSKSSVKSNMPANSKKSKTVVEEVVAPAPTPAPVKGRKSAAKSEVTVPVSTPSAAATVSVVAAPVENRSADAILTSLQETLKALSSDVSARIRSAVHDAIEATKALKREARDSKKRRKVDPATLNPEERKIYDARRLNNAFLKLRPLTDELSTFMGLPSNSQRSQTDVTKFVATYVKSHGCFDPNFKRTIIPDNKLGTLLRVKDGQEVTYLNLQSFLKVHFIKTAVVPV